MLNLKLSDAEGEMLANVLKEQLLELHTEISHTDLREYRRNLKKMEATLQHLLKELAQAA
jgi:5S rRNA maturation endonuclease (ribonuclease M5)